MMRRDWITVPLGKVVTLQRGYDLPNRWRRPGSVPIVTSSGIGGTHNEAMVSGPGVVTGRYGTIGEVFYIESDFWPLNTTLFVRNFHGNDPLFVSYLLRTIDFQTHSGKSGVPGVNRNDLHEVVVALPPTKAEQEAIAEALSDADALIESLEQLIAKKRQIKQGAIQELLTGKRRLPGFTIKLGYKQTEVGVIPEDWEVMRVHDLVKHGPKNGYSGRSSQDSRGTPTLSLAATSSGQLLLNQDTVKYLENRVPADSPLFLEPGDILVQRSNTVELVGTTAIFNGPAATFVYPDLIMRLRFKKRATAEWFWRYANSTIGRRFFSRVAAGSTGSMPKISGDQLRDMVVPLPPLAEQEALATILSDMDTEIAALEEKLAKARQVKQGMMQELLTGKTRLIENGKWEMEHELG